MDTVTGFHVLDSHQITPIQSLFHAVGIVPSRYGIWPIANWRSTTMDTTVILTLLPYHQTVPSVLQEVKTTKPFSGTWMMENIYTPWTIMTSSMHYAFHQTDTGSVLPMVHPSKSGIWHARKWLKNFVQKLFHKHQKLIHHNVCHSPGQQTDKHFSPDTPITQSEFGKYLYQLVKLIFKYKRKAEKITFHITCFFLCDEN